MKHTVEFECGEKHCEQCRFVDTKRFGCSRICALNGEELFFDDEKKLARSQKCLDTYKEVKHKYEYTTYGINEVLNAKL